ncbi:MAG TPA: ABC transporter substrate-binding protein, partial [Thermoleophilaceae bacterium]|nr:ABC transporter substrate-binding protein [Thermoleophilaceae bacterium]
MKKPLILIVFTLAVVWFAIDALRGLSADTPGSRSAAEGARSGQDAALVVGSANFPENALLAELYAGALSAAGLEVDTALNLGSREVLFPAMDNGDITIVPEYTGALLDYLAGAEAAPATSTDAQLAQLEIVLPEGLKLLDPSTAQDQETVTCRPEIVERYQLESLDDLGPVSGALVMGGPPELAQRAGRFSLPGLKSAYGIEFAEFKPLDVAGPLTVAALRAGKIDCANLFSTQSAITTNGFISLRDPRGLIESQ